MNAEIRPDAELALRQHIERAVRPVRAGRDRKLVMREELLGHLTALYADERERQPDDQAAMAAALTRFGEPAALTAELNAAVGWAQRIAYHVDRWESTASGRILRWLGPRSEPWHRFALHTSGALALFNVLLLGSMLLLAALVGGWPNDLAATLPILGAYFLLLVVGEVATAVFLRSIYQAFFVHRRPSRWFWAGIQILAWGLLEGLLSLPSRWYLFGELPTLAAVLGNGLPFVALLVPTLVMSACVLHFAAEKRKKHEAWTTLVIDE